MHLRLRFPNRGKPRTAGLCGRAAGACDCGPLSSAFIERVNKGQKPPKRDFAGGKKPSPKARFSIVGEGFAGSFHTSPTNAATFVSRDCDGYTLAFANRIAHSGSQGETGAFRTGGGITTLGAFCAVRRPCAAGYQNGKLRRFLALVGCASEERREPAEQRCAHARRCSEATRPHWAA